jgi:hypothetical protein
MDGELVLEGVIAEGEFLVKGFNCIESKKAAEEESRPIS